MATALAGYDHPTGLGLTDTMQRPPRVKVEAHFMRLDIDWHCYSNSELCYVHPLEWRDNHREKKHEFHRSPERFIQRSADWILDAVDDLSFKHFIGWQCQLCSWPTEWSEWKHGDEGIEQYYNEKNSANDWSDASSAVSSAVATS